MLGEAPQVISGLLSAPAEAVVYGAREQRRIWKEWLRDTSHLLGSLDSEEQKKALLEKHLELAPTWRASARLSLGITTRIASLKKTDAGGSIGLTIGILQASGSFGHSTETTQESVLQIRAEYALSNDTEVTLSEYLQALGVEATDPGSLNAAIDKLGTSTTPIAEQGAQK